MANVEFACVVDGSLALAWCFADEQADYPRAVLRSLGSKSACVPTLWALEVANALVVGERRKRCTAAEVATWLEFLGSLPIITDDLTNAQAWTETLRLARAHQLSAYDASYLELASRRGLPMASLDEPLKKAAKASGVQLFVP